MIERFNYANIFKKFCMANTTMGKGKRQMTTGNNYLQFIVQGLIFLARKGISSQMVRKKTNGHQRKGQGYQKEKKTTS